MAGLPLSQQHPHFTAIAAAMLQGNPMKRFVLAVASLLLLLSFNVLAAAGPARARLDAFSQNLHSLSGRFSQTLTDANGQTGQASSGTLALEAPRQFRWDTLAPYKQTIVADGSRVWMYDPELEQVTVRVQNTEEAHSPLTVLTDLKQMDRDFKVTELGERDGLTWLRLTSTGKDPQFDHADLGFDANGLARMTFRDQLGSTTDIRFSDWQRNVPLPADSFNFVPPKGADVIGDVPVITTQPLKD
jgi:outer membrane lipoprotein carrier protein